MKIGIFGGSFDPPTLAHKICPRLLIDFKILDKVFLIPCSSKREDKLLEASFEERVEMLNLIKGENMEILDLEKNEYFLSADLMKILFKKYPEDDFYFILGDDIFFDLKNWEKGEEFLSLTKFIVLPRKLEFEFEFEFEEKQEKEEFRNIPFSLLKHFEFSKKMSSTELRRLLKEKDKEKDKEKILELTCEKIYDYILKQNLY